MIHIGAVCGAGVSQVSLSPVSPHSAALTSMQGKSTTMGVDTKLGLFRPFRNDR